MVTGFPDSNYDCGTTGTSVINKCMYLLYTSMYNGLYYNSERDEDEIESSVLKARFLESAGFSL